MVQAYLEAVALIERLHRQFLDVVKVELEEMSVRDVNNVQSLILFNIGDTELTVGELTQRGYYLGSNVSYNMKKMVENGYVVQERSPHDRRAVRIRLSEKGLALRTKLAEAFQSHADKLAADGLDAAGLDSTLDALRTLERFWAGAGMRR